MFSCAHHTMKKRLEFGLLLPAPFRRPLSPMQISPTKIGSIKLAVTNRTVVIVNWRNGNKSPPVGLVVTSPGNQWRYLGDKMKIDRVSINNYARNVCASLSPDQRDTWEQKTISADPRHPAKYANYLNEFFKNVSTLLNEMIRRIHLSVPLSGISCKLNDTRIHWFLHHHRRATGSESNFFLLADEFFWQAIDSPMAVFVDSVPTFHSFRHASCNGMAAHQLRYHVTRSNPRDSDSQQ